MSRISFQTALLLAPLAYALHHIEEHVFANFRAWRLKYFADNNQIPTEAVVCILMAITLAYLFLHAVTRSRASAQSAVLFLMATQVNNLIFHVGGTVVFQDWSPGTLTAVLLYLPVNILIVHLAIAEGWITRSSAFVLFLVGAAVFWSFEVLGPVVIVAMLVCTWSWIAYEAFTTAKLATSD